MNRKLCLVLYTDFLLFIVREWDMLVFKDNLNERQDKEFEKFFFEFWFYYLYLIMGKL